MHPAEPATKTDVKPSTTVTAQPENKTNNTPTLVYVGIAATGVFAVGATVFGLVEVSKKNEYDSVNRIGENPGKARDLKSSLQTYALMTDVCIGAAVLSAAGTAILYFTAPSQKPETKTAAGNWQLSPTVGQTQASLSLSGQF